MAGSLDTILQGVRDAGSGIAQGTQNYQEGQKLQAARDEQAAKKKAAQELNDRLGVAADETAKIHEKILDPNYPREEFESDLRPLSDAAIRNSDPTIMSAVSGLRGVFDARDKAAKDKAVAKKTEAKDNSKETNRMADRMQSAGDKLRTSAAKYSDAISAANDAENLVVLAKTEPGAAAAAIRKLARASGDTGVLSDADTKDFGGSKAYFDQIERYAVQAADGTLDPKTAQSLANVAKALRTGAEVKLDTVEVDAANRFAKNYKTKFEDTYEGLTGKKYKSKAAKDAETKVAEAKKKKESDALASSVDGKTPPDKDGWTIYSVDAIDTMMKDPDNQALFAQGAANILAIRAKKLPPGSPPPELSPGEKNAIIAEILKRKKIRVAPNKVATSTAK